MIFERNDYMFKDMIDREAFRAIVGHYGADYCSGDLSQKVIDEMLNRHVAGKEHIFKLFGNKLRVEREVNITVNSHQAEEIKRDFMNELKSDKKLIFAASLVNLLNWEEFSTNTIQRDVNIFNVSISKGTKLSKALMRLVLPEHQHKISTMHSMLNQKLFTKGKVVLSIDPCDYVTMSSNSSGWRSCHRLDGGEYRTGPIAYLNDSSSVICYVESSTPCKFWYGNKQYEHTNKTWRQIALVNPDATFAIQERQYPNSNAMNQNAVSDIFKELFETQNGKSYDRQNTEADILSKLHIDYANYNDCNNLYYNDIINEMFSYGNVVKPTALSVSDLKDLELPVKGEDVYCLSCGCLVDDSDSLYCCDCGYNDHDDDEW